ncbi:3700_t:CDS:1 [Acaulospora morrowiae]|uniref:3700_t:CDS:1 n=1 Tax=Acaulospora morrowiae TaxID=94023 RepID=A0A9N9DB71_9GLOM|nr:3700_t:CDS:1 [Acaulospora morrowiae]
MNNMICPHLPDDCVIEILEHIYIETANLYPKTLHNCILINKRWSKLAVPLLWRYPWQWRGRFRASSVFWTAIIRTIVSCLPKEVKSILFLYPPSQPRPMFDYVTYCQHISDTVIASIIDGLLFGIDESIVIKASIAVFNRELWKFFLSKCSSIKLLELPCISISKYPGAIKCLESLTELECWTFKSPSLFKELALICHNIQYLCISCDEDNCGLAALITSQKRLVEVTCISMNGSICVEIGQALAAQVHLETLNIQNSLSFSSAVFNSFVKLSELNITLDGDTHYDLNPLKSVTLPNLQNLYIMCNDDYPPLDIYAGLIERTQGKLKKVEIVSSHYLQKTECFSLFIKAISRSCLELKVVSIYYTEEVVVELLNLIRTCECLEEITISGRKLGGEHDKAPLVKPVFDILLNYGSQKLQKLTLLDEWNYSQEEVKEFLESWKDPM